MSNYSGINGNSFDRGNLKSHLVLLSKAADSIADGDLVDRRIRSTQNWSLLPTQVTHTHTHKVTKMELALSSDVCCFSLHHLFISYNVLVNCLIVAFSSVLFL